MKLHNLKIFTSKPPVLEGAKSCCIPTGKHNCGRVAPAKNASSTQRSELSWLLVVRPIDLTHPHSLTAFFMGSFTYKLHNSGRNSSTSLPQKSDICQ